MCRLFGMTAGPRRVRATFWLLDAEDSLAKQSRREPDGVGLGVFDEHGQPFVHKRPIAAYEDREFVREARELAATTFVAHIRFASTGDLRPENTHPFEQDGRLFAHNGVVEDLAALEAELGDAMDLVHGDTDSERVFALITAYARRTGDLGRGIVGAVGWIAQNLPVYALNLILTTPTELWALRYPDTHRLFVLRRGAGGPRGDRHLEHASAQGTMRVRSGDLGTAPAVVVASERMDEDTGWRLLDPGELLHVGADLEVTGRVVLDKPPVTQLTLADLHPRAAASQS
ncbi:MAG TPA: class II glutamine amidotransferase [Micromonosporaceae bacterium]|nr:class II glutamine amidotransferase [Micromonosporaceae bacterium]